MMLRLFARRTILKTASLLLLAPGLIAPGLAAADPATDFVASFGGKLAHILSAPISLKQKQTEILPLLQENVDIEGIGQYCLGRYWRKATPDQKKRYLALFHKVLLFSVTKQIGNYQNVDFSITGTVTDPDHPTSVKVTMLIRRPGQPDINMTVVVDTAIKPPKVIDLYGEGASMRLTQRGDYNAYLDRHGGITQAHAAIEAMITALQSQIDGNSQP